MIRPKMSIRMVESNKYKTKPINIAPAINNKLPHQLDAFTNRITATIMNIVVANVAKEKNVRSLAPKKYPNRFARYRLAPIKIPKKAAVKSKNFMIRIFIAILKTTVGCLNIVDI
jgi:hypothetical protein